MVLLVKADDVLQQGKLLKVIFVLRVVALFDVTRRNLTYFIAATPCGDNCTAVRELTSSTSVNVEITVF
jgi:hypothetical protein